MITLRKNWRHNYVTKLSSLYLKLKSSFLTLLHSQLDVRCKMYGLSCEINEWWLRVENMPIRSNIFFLFYIIFDRKICFEVHFPTYWKPFVLIEDCQNVCWRFRIALKKTFPNCSRPVIGVLHTFLGQESSSNYSLGDIQLHLTLYARKRISAKNEETARKLRNAMERG